MINKNEIMKVIPHRGNMLLVDEIREANENSGVGIRHVRNDEFWVDGHFPGKPIMPGVLQIEALAQTACFIVFKQLGTTGRENLGYFTTMEKIKFYHMVMPGDTLELHVEVLMKKMRFYKFHGIAMVCGKKVSEATFSAIMDVPVADSKKLKN
jgi:3-hydroxyacyl-[acyl-carrier-protein] dehydratase